MTAGKLRSIVEEETPRLLGISEEDAARRPAPGKWCRKEILGHLIDSAANNQQRFLRARLAEELRFPGYAQDDWVSRQGYAEEEWSALVDLWASCNMHLSHVIARLPKEDLAAVCRIGTGEPMSLGCMIEEYVRHLEHHLQQIDPAYVSVR
jgi:hypothetical protein